MRKINSRKNPSIFLFILLIISIYSGFNMINKSNKKINDKEFVQKIIEYSTNYRHNIIKDVGVEFFSMFNDASKLLSMGKSVSSHKVIKTISKTESKSLPLIYIYNTHQLEEYKASDFLEYSIKPTVMINDYIMKEVFDRNNLNTMVEERSIRDILNQNKWNYTYSYKASRYYMEDSFLHNSSLKYFIDVHRDSIGRDKTTVSINSKSYAKILFIVGLDNSKYESNLAFTEKINNIINSKYPNLSKGIMKKSGKGVNGVYNQDFSSHTILVEMGGGENTTSEVMNTSLAFSECFMEAIKSEDS